MIDELMVKEKVAAIQRDLRELTVYKDATLDEIVSDYRTHKAVERMLEVIINEAIDINQHLIVKSGHGQLPFDFRESFLLLINIGVYPVEFGKQISGSVGLRNILFHQYRKLDEQIFFSSIRDCLTQYTKYCEYILAFVAQKN